jgi:CheY-like chemotaxis protein
VRALPARDLWTVEADRGQIEQVIMNLAVNSRDAMPKGGRLTMETANIELDAAYCESNPDVEPGEYVMLAVTDTGVGMDVALIPRIFEPFFTTKEKGKGTGLGLSMVYGAVKQNRGHITVYSEPGKGTTFRVYWPRARKGEPEKDTRPTRSMLPRGTETVLVVEDEEPLRRYACRLLGSLGYNTLQAQDGEHALQVAEQAKVPIDLLMTDVIMPRLGGRELAQELRRRLPGLKVLFTSGYTAETIAHEGILEEGINFLEKPFGQKELADRVRAALDDADG